MDATNTVAHELEGYGVRTFSEMAFNILGLMHLSCSAMLKSSQFGPISTAAWIAFPISRISRPRFEWAIARDNAADFKIVNGNSDAERVLRTVNVTSKVCIEMAWMMGFIKHFDGRLKDGSLYVGWVDAKTSEPVDDKDVRVCYEKDILPHAGVRMIGESCGFVLF